MKKLLSSSYSNIFLLAFALLLAGIMNVEGATFYCRQTGNWTAKGTWSYTSGGGQVGNGEYPGAADNVIIEGSGRTVTLNAASACTNVTISSGATLSVGGYSFTVSGTTTVNGAITFTNTAGTKTMGNVVIAGGAWTSNVGETYGINNLTLSGATINGSNTGILNVGSNLTVTAGTTNTLNATTITINGTTTINGNLIFASTAGNKIFVGQTTINSGGNWDNDNVNEAINFQGGLTNNGTFAAGTSVYTFSTNNQNISGTISIPSVTVTGITLTNNGSLTVGTALLGTGGITQGVNSTLNIGGTSTITTMTATASGNIVNYTGAAQTVKGTTYNHLTLSGSGNKTLGASTTTNGNVTISTGTTLVIGAYNFAVSGTTTVNGTISFISTTGTVSFTGLTTINSTGIWNNSSNEDINFRGGLTNNGTFTAGTGSYTFTTNAQTLNGTISIPNLSSTVALTNNGTLTVGTLLSGTGSLIQSIDATLNIGGTSTTITTLTATNAGNTVNYYGASQTVKVTTYVNLTLSGSGTKTTTSSVRVNGILSIEGSVTAVSSAITYGIDATLQYNTASSRTAGAEWITPFAATGGVNIINTGTITLNTAKVFNATAPLTIGNGATLSRSTYSMTINGIVTNSGTISNTAGVLQFNSGSTYDHAQNGGTVPTATWNATSNCKITGITDAATLGGLGQTFGNFTWNCTGQTADLSLAQNLQTVNANLNINSTGTGSLRLVNGGGSGTILVTGDYVQTGGVLYICGTSGSSNLVLSVGGNFSLSTGTLNINGQTGTGSLNVAGNFTMNSGTITESSTGSANVYFNGTNQRYEKTGGTISNAINFTVNYGSTLDVGTSLISGDGNFTLSSGAGIVTAHPQGISTAGSTGSIQVTGTRNYSTGGSYGYSGSTTQETGNGLTGAYQLLINNPAGVTLTSSTSVSGGLLLYGGKLTTSATSLLSITNSSANAIAGGSANAFINGPLKWTLPASLISGTSYNFPIGKGTTYLPFSLVNPTTGTGAVSAQVEAFDSSSGGITDASLSSKSTTEYWSLTTSGNFANSAVTVARPAAIAPLNVIGGSATFNGTYTTLDGTEDTYGVNNSNPIGTNRCFLLASNKPSIITGGITGSSFCAGTGIEIPYTVAGNFGTGNIFTAQLSNATGSFTSPVTIGTLVSRASGTIQAVIPLNTSTGSGYRIRVVSNNPVVTGSDNGSNLTINASPSSPIVGTITQPTCDLATGSVVLSGLPSSGWTLTSNPGGIFTAGTGTSTTVTGLGEGAYTFMVSEGGTGLTGSYFSNKTLSGSPVLTRTDGIVDFDWAAGGPGGTFPVDNFSVRWTGMVQPLYSETYTFQTISDDGIRLWVNGVQIINNWTDHGTATNTGTISLTAGTKYDIVLEYYENAGSAIAKLSWSSASQPLQIIPQSRLYANQTSGCSSAVSAEVVIQPQPSEPVILLTTPSSRCGVGSVTIGATASGGIVRWYNTSTGGAILATGNSFTIASLPANTTYYAEAFLNGCPASARVAVQASIIPSPEITATGGGTYCSGSTVQLGSSSVNITNQYWTGPKNFYALSPNPVLSDVTADMSGVYRVIGSALSGVNLVTNGDFEMGNTGFKSEYARAAQTSSGLYDEGTYDVVAAPSSRHDNFCSCPDHTSGAGTLQLVINGASTEKKIWTQTVNVNPNTPYQFTYWVQTVVNGNDASPSKLQLFINGKFAGPIYTANPTTGVWTQFTYNWTSGSEDNEAILELKNENFASGGNDFALDDIVFQQACEAIAQVTVFVNDPVTAGSIGTSQTICSGYAPATITSTVGGTGLGTITYEWEANAGSSFGPIEGATSSIYSPPALSTTTRYRRRTVSESGGVKCYSTYSNEVTITVSGPAPVANAGTAVVTCYSSGPLNITAGSSAANHTGIEWTSNGTGIFTNANSLTLATYTPSAADISAGSITLTLTAKGSPSCDNAVSTKTLTITPLPSATISYAGSPFCESEATAQAVTLTGTTGGTYSSSPAGLSINVTSGAVIPSSSIPGTYTVTYTMAATGGCTAQSATASVTILPRPMATISPSSITVCQGSPSPLVTLTNTQSLPERIILAVSGVGDYQFDIPANSSLQYPVPTDVAGSFLISNIRVRYLSGPVCEQTLPGRIPITITPPPVATFNYPGSPYCNNQSNPFPAFIGGGKAGMFSSTAGLIFVSTATGEINLRASNPGTYIITNTIAASGGCSVVAATFEVTILPDGSWTGAINQDWNEPGNWACNQLPTLTTNVTIASKLDNYPIVTSTNPAGMASDISIGNGASVTVKGGKLQIAGNIAKSSNGIFTAAEGTIEMKGTAAQMIGANVFDTNTLMNLIINNIAGVTLQGPLNIKEVVSPEAGNFNAGDHYLTLLSTDTRTALIDGSGMGNVLGIVNMQRYLPNSFGYKYLSSPFTSATVAELADEVVLKETFPTFYKYDEDHHRDSLGITVYYSGWTTYKEPTNALVPMQGYAANLGASTEAKMLTMSGVVNNGDLFIPLYNNNRKYTKGFNLVGNPYPSPINWNASGWTKTNIDGAIYFFNAGTTDRYTGVYTSYVNGQSSGGEDNIIPAMQGFFVHVTDPVLKSNYPVNAILGFSNSIRTNNLNTVLKSATIDTRPAMRLTAGFEGNNAIEDAALVYFDPSASLQFEREKDALKLENTDKRVPNIYTLAVDNQKLSINGLSEPSDSVSYISVGITTLQDGTLRLRAENAYELPFMQVYLADGLTGQYHDLRQSPEMRFTLQKGIYDSRFKLVFSKAPFTGQYPGMEKMFTLMRSANRIQVKVNLPAATQGNLRVTNILGQAFINKVVTGKETVDITQSISSGVYIVTLVSGKRTASEKILMRTDYE